jgi:hypothetical protein
MILQNIRKHLAAHHILLGLLGTEDEGTTILQTVGNYLTQQHSLISYETSHCRFGRLVNCTGDYVRYASICSEMFTGVNVLMSRVSVTE